jgi:hypothetical protein
LSAGVILFGVAAAMPCVLAGQTIPGHITRPIRPYTAEYRMIHTQRLADGNLINLESKEVVAVDSQRRRMTSKTGSLVPAGDPLGTRVFVFDPVARTTTVWTAPGQRATVNSMPEPGAPRGCPATSTRSDVVDLGSLGRSSRSKPVVEDLGTDTVLGIRARGTRRTTTIPAGEIGNQAPLVSTRETWLAVDPDFLGLVVREISDDPQFGRTSREMVSLDQSEPDQATFQPPAGYEIVRMTMSQTSCSTEPAAAPQQ